MKRRLRVVWVCLMSVLFFLNIDHCCCQSFICQSVTENVDASCHSQGPYVFGFLFIVDSSLFVPKTKPTLAYKIW